MDKSNFGNLNSTAKTVLKKPKHVELMQWIGTGPSIRARARLALIAAFLVATPTLFIGVMRTDDVVRYAKTLNINDIFRIKVNELRILVEKVSVSLWRYEAQTEQENKNRLLKDISKLRSNISFVVNERPADFESKSIMRLAGLAQKLENIVVKSTENKSIFEEKFSQKAMAKAILTISSLENEVHTVDTQIRKELIPHRQTVINALSRVGRDQLVLFLVLLFAIPIFVGFTPGWLVAPLIRLKRMEHRIEQGNIRDLGVSGRDEISDLARALQGALIWREELDQRKSAKIFEIRNVLRSVINHVSEAVFIIDKDDHINYVNEAASEMLDIESHHLEGSSLNEHVFAPDLEQALLNAKQGNVLSKGMKTTFEMSQGRKVQVTAQISAVHERLGGVSRIVLVLNKDVLSA